MSDFAGTTACRTLCSTPLLHPAAVRRLLNLTVRSD